MKEDGRALTNEELSVERTCALCEKHYRLEYFSGHFFDPPYNYYGGCAATCLTCWLGCGSDRDDSLTGDLLREFATKLGPSTHLVVLPIHRLIFAKPIQFQSRSIIYPRRMAQLDALNLALSDDVSNSLAVFQSRASGVDKETFSRTPTVVFTCDFEWDSLWRANYKAQMESLRLFSQIADMKCLNWIRYRLCEIGLPDALPSRAGQIKADSMMSAVIVYNAFRREGGVIAGDAFSSVVTKGLGLPLSEEELPYNEFPDQEGEVGNLVLHALDLYSTILQAEYPTTQFIQLMALLEFLADPTDYTPSNKVAKTIGRYVAKNSTEYENFKSRYCELSGKKDSNTGAHIGYRTRIVHMGERLERILPSGPRQSLLKELDGYVRTVIDHMIEHSSWTFDSYLRARSAMEPFNVS